MNNYKIDKMKLRMTRTTPKPMSQHTALNKQKPLKIKPLLPISASTQKAIPKPIPKPATNKTVTISKSRSKTITK